MALIFAADFLGILPADAVPTWERRAMLADEIGDFRLPKVTGGAPKTNGKTPQQKLDFRLTYFGSILARIDPFTSKMAKLHLRGTRNAPVWSRTGRGVKGRKDFGTFFNKLL